MLQNLDVRLITVIIALLIVAVGEIGFAYGRRHAGRTGDEAPLGVTLAAAFGVVALLLGFSFQIAINRYDDRRVTLVDEANAIGMTILRTRLFDDATGAAMRSTLRQYLDVRIAFSEAGSDREARAASAKQTEDLQRRLWTEAMAAVRRDPRSTLAPLFVASLNNMIDAGARQRAILNAVIPGPILFVLLIVVLTAAALLGIDFGRKGGRAPVVTILFAVMLALVIGIITDLDQPQRGLIRVDLTPMRSLYQLF